MKRGEVWTISGGPDYTGKPRPAVIVQADSFDQTDSVTVCPLTTVLRDADILRRPVDATLGNGLNEPSQIMIDKVTTIPLGKLGQRLGTLSETDAAAVDESLLLFLGLARTAS